MMHAEVQVATAADDELERYLADSRISTSDPLSWWLGNRETYPRLARMAIDLHTIPGTSFYFFALCRASDTLSSKLPQFPWSDPSREGESYSHISAIAFAHRLFRR